MNDRKARNTQAIQMERRRLLIDATMSAIREHGLSKLTLAKIAGEAGLSAGSVNFHFDSKEALLLETLTFVAGEFEARILQAIEAAGEDPAARLQALFEASMDPQITEPRKMAVCTARNLIQVVTADPPQQIRKPFDHFSRFPLPKRQQLVS